MRKESSRGIRDNDRKLRAEHAPIHIERAVVEWIETFKFLGVHITNKLSWFKNTKTVVKRAPKHLLPLRRLKRFSIGPQILKSSAVAPSRAS